MKTDESFEITDRPQSVGERGPRLSVLSEAILSTATSGRAVSVPFNGRDRRMVQVNMWANRQTFIRRGYQLRTRGTEDRTALLVWLEPLEARPSDTVEMDAATR